MPPSNQPNTSSSCRRQPPRHVTDGGNRTLLKERLVPTCNPPLNQHRTQLANKQATLNDDDDAMPPIDQPLPLTDDFPLLAEHSVSLADYSERAVRDDRSPTICYCLPIMIPLTEHLVPLTDRMPRTPEWRKFACFRVPRQARGTTATPMWGLGTNAQLAACLAACGTWRPACHASPTPGCVLPPASLSGMSNDVPTFGRRCGGCSDRTGQHDGRARRRCRAAW